MNTQSETIEMLPTNWIDSATEIDRKSIPQEILKKGEGAYDTRGHILCPIDQSAERITTIVIKDGIYYSLPESVFAKRN